MFFFFFFFFPRFVCFFLRCCSVAPIDLYIICKKKFAFAELSGFPPGLVIERCRDVLWRLSGFSVCLHIAGLFGICSPY